MFEILLGKELTANCLVETHMKLDELILAAIVEYSRNSVQPPLRMQQSLINGFSCHGLSWAIGHTPFKIHKPPVEKIGKVCHRGSAD